MSDGARLHEGWASALDDAATTLKTLLGMSSGWIRVGGTGPVTMHKKGSVLRVVLDAEGDAEAGIPCVEDWRAVFGAPELRKEWDPMVDKAQVLEVLDSSTRVSKTDYALGWPANPRDAITISRTIHEGATLVDISTSLPRSADEPAYLRPSPPSVRSHVHLFAWCIQLPTPPATSTRITLFWQHDLRNAWPLSSSSPTTALPALLPVLYSVAVQRAPRAPLLHRWGSRAVIDAASYDPGRAALRLDYTIVPEDDHPSSSGAGEVEVWLSPLHAWEAQITTRAASDKVASLPWTVHASRSGSGGEKDRTILRVAHAPVPAHSASALKVRFIVELGGGSRGTLRVNGAPHSISPARAAPRPEPGLGFAPNTGVEILSTFPATITNSSSGGEAGRPGSITAPTVTTAQSQSGAPSISSSSRLIPSTSQRPSSHQKAIQTLIRRSYTYFTALLQEPDQKWKPLLESRGVTVTQLDSIDPTLVVYRAEATFVGVGVWDLLGALGCEPARGVWEKGVEDVRLVEDVNELTELWWVKMRAAWPVNPRDTLLLKTSYKSPTAAHVFSFSTTDTTLFPALPPPELPTIRTHVDLHGFAIEALSPTTTLLTLLEQSRVKTGAAGMVATLAGIGEMVIRGGGAPPVVSRLSGARKTRVRYEHERGVWRVEYEKSERAGGADDGEDRDREKRRAGARRSTRSSSLRHHPLEDEANASGDADEEADELGASVATVIPGSGRRRGSPLSVSTTTMSMSSSPDSISRTSLAPSSTSTSSNPGVVFPSMESANGSSATITNSNKGGQEPLAPIELELRIDPDTWSPLELVVDPPPSSVRALRRHRLARGGGGLWVTVEHAIEPGWDERISVLVRKGNGGVGGAGRDIVRDRGESGEESSPESQSPVVRTARDELLRLRTASDARPTPERSPTSLTIPTTPRPPTLIVNGARVKVDVEELAEGEAKALSRAKRVKPARVPLDEPPVLWTRRARGDTTASGDTNGGTGAGDGTGTDTEAEGNGGGGFKSVTNWGMGMGSLGLGMGGLRKMWTPAGNAGNTSSAEDSPASTTVLGLTAPDVQSGVETVVTSMAQPSTLLRLVTNTPATSAVPTASPQPPMASALGALKFLARQHTANSTPDAIPTADGWAPVNTKAGLTVTRRTEPAFSSTLPVHRCAKVLQGVSAEDVAGAITCAGSRRQWDTWFDGGASAVLEEYGAGARTEFAVLKGGFPFRDRGFYVSSVAARTNTAAKGKDAGSSGGPALIFLASASYPPEGIQQFAPGKVNPYSLPVGQMPLYGWVIETLDPYTAENYAIPSARCTLYVCVDYGGQVPATYNAMVNATLPRASIAGVEAFLGGGSRASVPVVRYPASVLGVVRENEEEAATDGLVWTLGNEDHRRTFLGSSYNQTTNVFQASVRLSPHTVHPPSPSPQMPASAIEPSPSGSMLSVASHQRKTSNGGPTSGSGSGSSTAGASWGRAAGRLAISPRHRSRTLSSPVKAPSDGLTVAEFIVDSRLFPAGYDVATASMFLSEDSAQPVPLLTLDDSAATTRELPLKVSVYTVPLSPLRASAQPTRQLIRVTLPPTPQASLDILDPLTGETRRGPEQPAWVKRLAAERAVVRVTIGPGAIMDKIRVDGGITEALSEKKSLVALGRAGLEEEYVAGYPLLKRVKHVEGGQSIPSMLSSPVAAATHLYSDEPIVKSTPITAEKPVEEPASTEAPDSPDVPIISTPKSPVRPTPSRRPSASGIFGFLSSYTTPATRMPPINDAEKVVKPPASLVPSPPALPTIPEPVAVEVKQPTPAQNFLFDRRHSGARLIIVALIAFLVGSLLRSLISPADFIYMGPSSPTEHLDADGWRQVKRLVEIKYAWWGWDFVVAVVRRP